MSTRTCTATLFVWLLSVSAIHAQANIDLLAYYDMQTIRIGYQSFEGLVLTYQNETYTTSMGLARNMKEVLGRYEDTKRLVDSYSAKNLAGTILLSSGVGFTVGAATVPLVTFATISGSPNYATASKAEALTAAYAWTAVLAGVGLLSEVVGAVILPSSFQDLAQGVNTYNRHRIEEFGK